jgi:hypothetical protein
MAAAVAFTRPQIEAFIDTQLERPADELDRILAAAIDFIGGLRSDEAGDLIVTARGAYRTAGIHVDDDRGRHAFFVGDPVRAPDLGGGGDPVGQEPAVPGAVPVGGTAAPGDRLEG